MGITLMANPPHFSTIPLAEHIDHDIGHDTACHGDQNQIVTRPVPCIPVTMWQMTTHPRRYRTFRDPVRQRFSPHHVFPHTRRQRRITGITVLHRPVAGITAGNAMFRTPVVMPALFVRFLPVLFRMPVFTMPFFLRPGMCRHPHERPDRQAANQAFRPG